LYFIKNVFEGYAYFFEHGFRISGIVITPLAYDADDAAVYDEHGASAAGSHAAVERTAVYRNASLCGLTYGVLFRMNRPDAMLCDILVLMDYLLQLMPHVVAMRQS
jgi:hypothetical protein